MFLVFTVSLFFLSCDDIIDCIINVGPEIIDKDLKIGTINEFYSDRVTAGIKNEPHDDDYDYYFGISGNLPEGLEWIVDHKDIYFEGVPLEAGPFTFTIHLHVDGPETYDWNTDTYDDNLCYDKTSQMFTIIIN